MSDKPDKPSLLTMTMQHRVGVLALDISFALTQPWTVLFGPSGSGKSTVLRAIAGFVKPDAGRIVIGPNVLVDRAAGVFVPAHLRPVRSAGQSARLFPHKTVLGNIRYGAATAGIVTDSLDRFQLRGFADKLPRELSGGERQRVAVVRAAVAAVSLGAGTLLLLDEPFTGLDVARRDELLGELQAWVNTAGVPVLSVTHDLGEAFQLGAEVIKIAEGRVMAQGPVAEVLAEEQQRLMQQLGG